MQEPLYMSVIMPALNEEQNVGDALAEVLRGLDAFDIPGEVVVVNDGSTDRTAEVVAEWMERDPRVRRIDHDTPQGIGRAFWDGVDAAKGRNVVMIPGDNENDPTEIFRYSKLLDHVDMVIPFLYNREQRSMFRNILSLIYRRIICMTFVVNFNYTNGTVMYCRPILQQLPYRSTSFFFQTDILVRLAKRGYLFAEVPYRINMRETGKSKAVSFPSLIQVARGYFQLVKDLYFDKQTKLAYHISSMTHERKSKTRDSNAE